MTAKNVNLLITLRTPSHSGHPCPVTSVFCKQDKHVLDSFEGDLKRIGTDRHNR